MATVVTETDHSLKNDIANFAVQAIQFFRHYAPMIIIVFGILIRLPLTFLPLTYSATDTWRQADTASIAHNFVDGGNILYPQIDWGGTGPGYVEAEFQLFPFIVSKLYKWFGEQVGLGRLVALVFTTGAFIFFYLLARRIVAPKAALWALFFLVVSPLSIRYSVAFMPEATVFFFYISALYFFDKWLEKETLTLLLASGVCTAFAILVKPTSIHIGLIFLLLVLIRHRLGVFKRLDLWLFAIVSLLPSILWYLHARNLYLEYGNTFGVISGGDSKLGNFSYWLRPGFYLNLARLDFKWIFAATGIIPFLIGLGIVIRKRQLLLLIFGIIVIPIYYMIVARYAQAEWGIQYHIYALPYAAIGVGLGLEWLFEQLNKRVSIRAFIRSPYILVGVATLAFMAIISLRIYRSELLVPVAQPLAECAKSVAYLVPEDSRIIVGTESVANENGTPNNYQEPNIFFYSHRYGWSLPADWYTPEKVEEFRRDGAAYLIVPDDHIVPALTDYLGENATQIGPGVESRCGIYEFKKNA